MRLCMFHPAERTLERGWVGRVEGDVVKHLAAQTLQSFFTGGGSAREHAEYPLDGVRLLAPVLHPPAVRLFDTQSAFAFANPAAICGPGKPPRDTASAGPRALSARLAAVVGAGEELAGLTLLAEWRDPALAPPKDRDFWLGLGPVVVTRDELDPASLEGIVTVDGRQRGRGRFEGFDWDAARDLAARGTRLYPGDLLAGPSLPPVAVEPGSEVELAVPGIGTLSQSLSRD